MESTVLHIEYLLQRHDCVILPGIGALIATRQAARWDEESGRFYPPMRQICFNSAVSTDDGLLVDSIRRRGKLGFEEARRIMLREIESIRTILERDMEVSLGRIGALKRDNEGNISFHPFQTPVQIMAGMGYSVIDTNALSARPVENAGRNTTVIPEEATAEAATEHREAEEMMQPAKSAEINSDPITSEEEPMAESEAMEYTADRSRHYHLYIRKSYARIAASLLLTLCVAIAVMLPQLNNTESTVEANVLPIKELIEDSTLKTKEKSVAKTEQGIEATDIDYYHLIVASFHKEEEANEFLTIHKESSYGLQIEYTGRIWLISAALSADKRSLLELSRSDDFRKEYPQSWVWKR